MSSIMFIYSFLIILLAGMALLELPLLRIKDEPPAIRAPIYFMAGCSLLSLYMFLLFMLRIEYSIISISAPFLIYLIYYLYRDHEGLLRSFGLLHQYINYLIDEAKKRENRLFITALALISAVLATVIIENLITPIYIGDVYCMWYFKPKAMFMAKTIPVRLFTDINLWFNTSIYPLLTSLNVAWIAICLGKWSDTVTKSFYTAQYIAAMVFFYAALKRYVNSTVAMIGVFVTFSIPHIIGDITTGYVDLIVAFYGLFAIVCLLRWMDDNRRAAYFFLSAFFVGSAVWSHNEGLMLFAAMMLTLLVYFARQLISKKMNIAAAAFRSAVYILIYLAVTGPFKALCKYYGLKEFWVSSIWQLFDLAPNLWRIPIVLGAMLYELFLDTYLWLYFWIFLLIIVFMNRKKILSTNLIYPLLFVIFSLAMVFEVFYVANAEASASWLIGSIRLNLDRAMLIIPISAGFLMFASLGKNKDD